jgi:hypothetical protein
VAPAVPATAACPAPSANNETSWRTGMDRQAAANVVNTINGQARPAFNYDSTDMTRITRVRTDLFVDTTPNARPVETRLRSGVYLRNQNRQPTASFTATVTADKRLILNGSASEDPEGMPLSYQWYIDPPATLPDCKVLPVAASCAGTGVVFEKTGLSGGGSHTIKLVVSDPALLAGTTSRTVTYPS